MSCKIVLFALASALICSAQVEQGAITGDVVDQSGAAIPGAKVRATNQATMTVAAVETTAEGYYKIPYLLAGKYTVVAEKEGFSLARVTSLSGRPDLHHRRHDENRNGTRRGHGLFQCRHGRTGKFLIGVCHTRCKKRILELPTGRSPYSLLTLSPGVIATGNSGTGPIVSGGRSNTSAILFDGQDTRNNSTLDNAYTPPQEAVQEVRFITNGFSAEYGRSAGSVWLRRRRSQPGPRRCATT